MNSNSNSNGPDEEQRYILVKENAEGLWYFTGLEGSRRARFDKQCQWSQNIERALFLDGPTASEHTRKLVSIYTDYPHNGGEACSLSLMEALI